MYFIRLFRKSKTLGLGFCTWRLLLWLSS